MELRKQSTPGPPDLNNSEWGSRAAPSLQSVLELTALKLKQ
jgi:hypothetical protein